MRVPLIPTILVGLAVAAMIGLGIWQLGRGEEKRAAIAQIAANRDASEIAFPEPPVGDQYLFRRAAFMCLEVVGWQEKAGRDATGTSGWRHLAECRTGADGMTILVDIGVTRAPGIKPEWKGGEVSGIITHAPDSTPFIASLLRKQPPRNLMLVAAWDGGFSVPKLTASAAPDPASLPNNHLSYAVQWFLFAGVAVVIYLLALKWRAKKQLG